jgi:PPOX class probable F420-dependent enzyme
MPIDPTFASLAAEKYVLLTTFRKTGVGVPTAVWVAPDGDDLVVITVETAGKVKRIRNNPTVTLQPCTMTGKVKKDAAPITAHAEILAEGDAFTAGLAALEAKYGWQFRLTFRRRRKASEDAPARVILRLAPVAQ